MQLLLSSSHVLSSSNTTQIQFLKCCVNLKHFTKSLCSISSDFIPCLFWYHIFIMSLWISFSLFLQLIFKWQSVVFILSTLLNIFAPSFPIPLSVYSSVILFNVCILLPHLTDQIQWSQSGVHQKNLTDWRCTFISNTIVCPVSLSPKMSFFVVHHFAYSLNQVQSM